MKWIAWHKTQEIILLYICLQNSDIYILYWYYNLHILSSNKVFPDNICIAYTNINKYNNKKITDNCISYISISHLYPSIGRICNSDIIRSSFCGTFHPVCKRRKSDSSSAAASKMGEITHDGTVRPSVYTIFGGDL